MATTTPLGFQAPDGNDLVRNGDNAIAANAELSQVLHAAEHARLIQLERAAGFNGTGLELADAVVAPLIDQPTSQMRVKLDARYVDETANTAALAGKVAKGDLVFNVKDYGAVGDGTTNDSTAFTSAISAIAANGGGTLLIPPGTYNILARIKLTSNLRILGYGATLTKTSTAGGYAIFYTGSGGVKGYGSGDSTITIEGVTVRGNYAGNIELCAVAAHHTDGLNIVRCRFIECAGQGHVFDLAGCSNVTIRDSLFAGFKNAGGGYARSEAIQLDLSVADFASAPDTAGSWDALPTKNVTVEGCRFLPLTVGGTTYPAPNPLGSHNLREGAWHENIRFTGNHVLDPLVDATSATQGVLHFLAARNIRITDNTFEYSTPQTTILLGLYSTDQGTAAGTSAEAGVAQTITTVTALPVSNVVFERNRLKGFAAAVSKSLITIQPMAGSGNIIASNITISKGEMEMVSGSSATNFIGGSYVARMVVEGVTFTGPGRPTNLANVTDLTVRNNRATGPRADAFRADSCTTVKNDGNTITGAAGTSLYASNSTNVHNAGNDILGTVAGTRAVAFNGCNKFGAIGNNIEAPTGTAGIEIYGASSYGYATRNIISGGTATHVVFAGTGVSEDNNLKL